MADGFALLIDRRGRISQVMGDASATGHGPEALCALQVRELMPDDHRELIDRIIRHAAANAQGIYTDLPVLTGGGTEATFRLVVEPAGPEKLWLRFRPGGAADGGSVGYDEFFEEAGDILASTGTSVDLTMVDIAALRDDSFAERLGRAASRQLHAAVERTLATRAAGGRVGRLDTGSYGMMRPRDLSEAALLGQVTEAAGRLGVSGSELGLSAHSVAVDQAPAPGALRGTLAQLRRQFLAAVRGGAAMPPASMSAVAAELATAVARIEAALGAGRYALRFRPVMDVGREAPALLFAQGVLTDDPEAGEDGVAATDLLVLEEYPDLALRHDLEMLSAAAAHVAALPEGSRHPCPHVLNVTDVTLQRREFIQAVAATLHRHSLAADEIGFRAPAIGTARTRAKAVDGFRALNRAGHPMSHANFPLALEEKRMAGVYLEVPAPFLYRLTKTDDGFAMLRRLTRRWNNGVVKLIATHAQAPAMRRFVDDMGIKLLRTE